MSSKITCPGKNLALEYAGKHRARFLARIPADHTVDDVMAPEYFGDLIAPNGFREGDLIEAEWEDYSRYLELQVRAVESSLRIVTVVSRGVVSEYDIGELPAGWSVEFRNSTEGWAILQDGQQVEAGFPTTDRARNRIAYLATSNVGRQSVIAVSRRGNGRKVA